MALPMLAGGTECGPSNPLQSLSKQLDKDRGVQQDLFQSAHAGSSREAFRTAHQVSLDHDATRFFSSPAQSSGSPAGARAFDLSALNMALPTSPVHAAAGPSPMVQAPRPVPNWAADFMTQQPASSSSSSIVGNATSPTAMVQSPVSIHSPTAQQFQHQQQQQQQSISGNMQWMPQRQYSQPWMNYMPNAPFAAQAPEKTTTPTLAQHDQALWDKEFQSHEDSINAVQSSSSSSSFQSASSAFQTAAPANRQTLAPGEADELARTAGRLVETLRGEQNPKFQNSRFMGLMRQLQNREVVVDGNDLVEASNVTSQPLDVKGKGKAVETVGLSMGPSSSSGVYRGSLASDPSSSFSLQADATASAAESSKQAERPTMDQESDEDAYWRQENADFTNWWKSQRPLTQQQQQQQQSQPSTSQAKQTHPREWGDLQAAWDQFEATESGIRAVNMYQFQSSNPYLRESTRHHWAHSTEQWPSFYQNVLELEAAVQREPQDARRWYDLGVKQQENEREDKAIQALERSVELDPTYLPTWLALAISYTNDGNRQGTYDALEEWATRNPVYAPDGWTKLPESMPFSERNAALVDRLMAMIRTNPSDDIDADLQIALAVLLNSNEDYVKALDCFQTALAVRPDDWLLYNRVGATMANSGDANEALQYYYRALELNPIYIRARYNLGISCINLRRYREAAQHIMDALLLQDGDQVDIKQDSLDDSRGVTSTALWDSLKTTCLHLSRIDLATLCDKRDLQGFRAAYSAPA